MALEKFRQPVVDFIADAFSMGYKVSINTPIGKKNFAMIDAAVDEVDTMLDVDGLCEIMVYSGHHHVATLVVADEPQDIG